jgi:replicative superfamily II helicase
MSVLDRYLDDLGERVDADTLLTRFLEYTSDQGLELYPAQEEAVMELFVGNNVILNTPTGSGKSLVALAAHFRSVALGEVLRFVSSARTAARGDDDRGCNGQS